MRKTSYIAKTVSDSVLGIALLTMPVAFLIPSNRDLTTAINEDATTLERHDAPRTALASFLETEIRGRMKRVHGRDLNETLVQTRSTEIASAINEASLTYDVDPFLLMAMVEVESRYHVEAVGRHGEIGLMQIKPSTARWIQPVTNALWGCDLHEIRCNIMSGALYVSHLQARTEKRRGELLSDLGLKDSTGGVTASLREHVLRSYNLGPARANRLASERREASDRDPAGDLELVTAVAPSSPSYAQKISRRADHLRGRYQLASL